MQEAKTTDIVRLQDYPNKPLEAYYLQTRVVDTQQFGEQLVHKFEKLDGNKIETWGFDQLNKKLEQVPKLSLVKITYLGKKESKKPGQHYHDVTVLFDANKKLNNTAAAAADANDDLPF